MPVPDDVLTRFPPQDYDVVRKLVRTGDLCLCSGTHAFSRLISWATRSPWSHLGLVVRLDEIDRVMVLESVEKRGVRAVALSRFISEDSDGHRPYPGKIIVVRHAEFAAKATPKRLRDMGEFAADRLGAPFNGREMTKIATRIVLGGLGLKLPGRLNPTDEYICSEYVGQCYERVGIHIPWDGRGFISPADFGRAPGIEVVAQIQTR